jgi:hypothetical protein
MEMIFLNTPQTFLFLHPLRHTSPQRTSWAVLAGKIKIQISLPLPPTKHCTHKTVPKARQMMHLMEVSAINAIL